MDPVSYFFCFHFLITSVTFYLCSQFGMRGGKFGGSVAEWLGRWTCNLVVLGSSLLPCLLLDLFSVVPSSTPRLCVVLGQLVCFWPIGIFKYYVYIPRLFQVACVAPEKPYWKSGQLMLLILLLFVLSLLLLLSFDVCCFSFSVRPTKRIY